MFMIFKQSKSLINIKEINQSKSKQNKIKKMYTNMKTRLNRG